MKTNNAFTLIELIMVIIIIGILAGISIPRFLELRSKTRIAACQGSATGLRSALANYYASAAMNSECSGTACWPATVSPTSPIADYLKGGFPEAPISGVWNDYYNNSNGALSASENPGGPCHAQ